jgi:hypothetical protein
VHILINQQSGTGTMRSVIANLDNAVQQSAAL